MSNCGDCDVPEGTYHHPGCDQEICPYCGGQLLSCDCCYEQLGLIDYEKNGSKYDGLTAYTYHNGLTPEQSAQWEYLLKKKGLIPHVEIPCLCAICGTTYPDMFMVSNKDWDKYVIPPLQKEMLCRPCYDRQKSLFPQGWRHAKEVNES